MRPLIRCWICVSFFVLLLYVSYICATKISSFGWFREKDNLYGIWYNDDDNDDVVYFGYSKPAKIQQDNAKQKMRTRRATREEKEKRCKNRAEKSAP